MDQGAAHPPTTSYLENVTLVFSPEACTSILQLLDQEITGHSNIISASNFQEKLFLL
jgi:hypothetical protein